MNRPSSTARLLFRSIAPLAVIGVLLGACGDSATTTSTQPLVAQRIVVTSVKGDNRSALLAAIFARVLEDAGFRVARKDPVALDRAGYVAALQSGQFQLIPDFTGDLLSYAYSQPGSPTAPTTIVPSQPATTQAPVTIPTTTLPPTTVAGDTTPTTVAPSTVPAATTSTTLPAPINNGRSITEQIVAIRAALPTGLAIDDGLLAEDKTVIACTEATMKATADVRLLTLSDLASIAPRIRIGGSAEFMADTTAGYPALQQFYGGDWKGTVTVAADGTAAAIEKADADCFALNSLDPVITTKKLTIISDDKAMVPANAAIALMTVDAGNANVVAAIDSLIASLTTERLNQMMVQVAGGTDPRVVADAFFSTI
ncbi:MAG: glycine betaine ABC transporter substrate-binding protein [Actinomycetota bacterium]